MIRGRQTIETFFPSNINDEKTKNRKNGAFTAERNECLITRFYFYYHIQKRRFDTTLEVMEKEFFISMTTITNYISTNGDLLKELIAQDLTARDLRKKYPHLKWD